MKREPVFVGGDSVFRTVETVGDAWSWLVMREAVFHDVRRFNEFRARLGISRETLIARLDRLVAGGLLERRAAGNGPFDEYALTACGRDFFICLATALRWGAEWCAGRRAPTLRLEHVGCGRPFAAVLRCSACGEPIRAREVSVSASRPVRVRSREAKRHREPRLDLLERETACSIARTLQVIGDRWSALVIRESFLRRRRFGDFAERLGIAPNILSLRLARLERLGVLGRRRYGERPVRREYRLTEKGLDIYPVPLAMLTWGDRWLSSGRPELVLAHETCGKRFTALLTCAECDDVVDREQVVVKSPR